MLEMNRFLYVQRLRRKITTEWQEVVHDCWQELRVNIMFYHKSRSRQTQVVKIIHTCRSETPRKDVKLCITSPARSMSSVLIVTCPKTQKHVNLKEQKTTTCKIIHKLTSLWNRHHVACIMFPVKSSQLLWTEYRKGK